MRAALLVLSVAACGRIGFGERDDAGGGASADTTSDTASIDAMHTAVTWVQPFAQEVFGGTIDSFGVTAHAAGNAFLIQTGCFSMATTPTVVVTAPGWSFTELEPLVGSMDSWAAVFAAIAPDTAPTTITVKWTGVNCANGGVIGDELANADPSGGAITFDGHVQSTGGGPCSATVATGHANDAVWAACSSSGSVTSTGPGFTKAADDQDGDWTEIEITTDPAGTPETATFGNTQPFVTAIVTVKPAS